MRPVAIKAGFTLMEVLVVLFIVGMLAAIAVHVRPPGARDEACYEETLAAMERIERAILGGPPTHLAGEHRFTGYAAHMGELPELLGEARQPAGLWTRQVADEYGAEQNLPLWHYTGERSRLWMGWRGPYLEAPGAMLRDGWGHAFVFDRFDPAEAGEEENDRGRHLRIKSLGANGRAAPDGTAETGYDTDIVLVIREDRYRGGLAGQAGAEVKGVEVFYPVRGEEASIQPQLAQDGYFHVPTLLTCGTRSLLLTGGSGRTVLFSLEPGGNWLGTLR